MPLNTPTKLVQSADLAENLSVGREGVPTICIVALCIVALHSCKDLPGEMSTVLQLGLGCC